MAFDLSAVTDRLVALVSTSWPLSPLWAELDPVMHPVTFTPTFSGLAPDEVRKASGPQLSMYMFHVDQDNAREAQYWTPQAQSAVGPAIQYEPLPLTLFYLLSAYAEKDSTKEQQAMSIAIRVFHRNAIVRGGPPAAPWELCLTREQRSSDELGRLWQAAAVGLRLSVVYRVSVVFLDPDPPLPSAPHPTEAVLVALGSAPAGPGEAAVLGTHRRVVYQLANAAVRHYEQSPAAAAPGEQVVVLGTELGSAIADRLYLLKSDGTEIDVTAWIDAAASTPTRFVVDLPAAIGAPPAAAPVVGVYQVRAGHGALGVPGSFRTAATPLSIAASIDVSGGPVVAGPPFAVAGAGFVAGATEFALGAIALAPVAGPPAAGQFRVSGVGDSIAFALPAGLASGTYAVRVRVHGIESDPGQWVVVP